MYVLYSIGVGKLNCYTLAENICQHLESFNVCVLNLQPLVLWDSYEHRQLC